MKATITLADGSTRDLEAFPCIFENEHGRPPVNDSGADIPFLSVRVPGGGFRPTVGSVDDFLIPAKAGGDPHIWPKAAALPVLANSSAWGEPSPERVAAVLAELGRTSQIGTLGSYPRLEKMVRILRDDGLPFWPVPGDQARSFGATDEGWEHRHGPGANSRVGWYGGAMRYGTEGLDNDHYNRTFWRQVNYLRDPSPALWDWSSRFTIGHMLYGRPWFGPTRGASRTEKSDGSLLAGRQGGNDVVLREKQWVHGVALRAFTTGDPLAEAALDAAADYLLGIDPASWKGYWGARVLSKPLDSVTLLGMVRPNLRARVVDWIGRALDEAALRLDRALWFWPNRGDPQGIDNSPWMQGDLVARICRAREQYPELAGRGPTDDELLRVVECIWTYGVEVVGDFRITEYRWNADANDADDVDDSGLHNTAWQIPALRYLAARFPRVEPLYREALYVVSNFIGSSKEDLRLGVPVPLDEVGARTPSQGLGWRKTAVFPLDLFR